MNGHVLSSQHDFLPLSPLQVCVQIRISEATRLLLHNNFLAALGLKFAEFLGQKGSWGENRGSICYLMHDMHKWRRCSAILFEQCCDRLASGVDVGSLQLPFGIPDILRININEQNHNCLKTGSLILGVDDDKNAVLGRSRGWLGSDKLSETFGHVVLFADDDFFFLFTKLPVAVTLDGLNFTKDVRWRCI